MVSIPFSAIKKQLILDALATQPAGMTRHGLQELPGLKDLQPQAVLRMLAAMVGQGQVDAEGRTKGRRYRLRGTRDPLQPEPSEGDYPPLSPGGEECRLLVAKPLSQRTPVSYRREFLDTYVPNVTFYLAPEARQHLAALGGPKGPERPAGTHARQILQRLLIDLSWNSSRLEGNTYSLLDTERLIELGEMAEGKDLQETQMILNHKAAIEYLVDSASELSPNPGAVQNLHAILMENLLANPMDEGCLRAAPVGLRGTTYLPSAMPPVIEECFRQSLHTAADIDDPFEQALFLLVHLPYLQPFLDGNKRTARIAANIPFICRNCTPITFMDLPAAAFTDGLLAVYEVNRVDLIRDIFIFAYERSCARYGAVKASLGEPDPFRLRYRAELKAMVRAIILATGPETAIEAQIRAYAEANLPPEARTRFRTVVETELAGLHDGNFARYHVRPSEFAEWRRRRNG